MAQSTSHGLSPMKNFFFPEKKWQSFTQECDNQKVKFATHKKENFICYIFFMNRVTHYLLMWVRCKGRPHTS